MTDKTSEQTGEQEIGEEILESDAIAGDDMLNIAIQYAPRDIDAPRSGPVQVGWLLSERKGAVIYDPPERVRSPEMSKRHAKSAFPQVELVVSQRRRRRTRERGADRIEATPEPQRLVAGGVALATQTESDDRRLGIPWTRGFTPVV